MFGFILKKNFCDTWDNLFSVVLINAMFMLLTAGAVILGLLGASYLEPHVPHAVFMAIIFALLFIVLFIINIIAFAYGEIAHNIADFQGVSLIEFFQEIPDVIKDAAIYSLFLTILISISVISIPFYFSQNGSLPNAFIGFLLIWVDIFFAIALQWYIPLRSTFHNNFLKCLKKCFIIFMDNTGFTLLVTLNNLLLLVFTVFFIGFLPSLTGILIANSNALRIRMYKYDYLEEHTELTTRKERRSIPWEELIYEDREALGPRKLKSFLFPWKDENK